MPLSPSVSCRVMRHLAVTGSTNADLAKLALSESETPEGFVLLADRQTAGKGRQGRSWTAPPDSGLTFSVLFRPAIPPLQAATFPLVVGFAGELFQRGVGLVQLNLQPFPFAAHPFGTLLRSALFFQR